MLGAIAKAQLVARLDRPARCRTDVIDAAGDAVPERTAKRETPTIGCEPQVGNSVGVIHDVFFLKIGARQDRVVGIDLDPRVEADLAIRRQVHAARAAGLALQGHAPLYGFDAPLQRSRAWVRIERVRAVRALRAADRDENAQRVVPERSTASPSRARRLLYLSA